MLVLERNLSTEKDELSESLLQFVQEMFFLRTGRRFDLSEPVGRERYYLTICLVLLRVMKCETNRLIINVPPRYGKTELLIHFVAWALAQFPDSNFLYVSYSLGLAKKQTKTIREIISMKEFQDVFDVTMSDDTSAQ